MSVADLDTLEVRIGDSLDLTVKLKDNRDLSDWACLLQVRTREGDLTSVDRNITTYNTDNTAFIARITPTETSTFNKGRHYVAAQLSNAATEEAIELVELIEVVRQYSYSSP